MEVTPKTKPIKIGQHIGYVRFDPHGPEGQQWFYFVSYVHHSDMMGRAANMHTAEREARKRVREMDKAVSAGVI
jgi:hypothetical protein